MNDNPVKLKDPKGDVPCCETAAAVWQTTQQVSDQIVVAGGGEEDVVTDAVATAVDVIGGIASGVAALYDLWNESPVNIPTPTVSPLTPPVSSKAPTAPAGTAPSATKPNATAKQASKQSAGQTAAGHPTDKYGNKLGPSGKPQINTVRHSNQKSAKDAARAEGKGAPAKHTNPKKGGDHYHPTDKDGNKEPNSTHHEY